MEAFVFMLLGVIAAFGYLAGYFHGRASGYRHARIIAEAHGIKSLLGTSRASSVPPDPEDLGHNG